MFDLSTLLLAATAAFSFFALLLSAAIFFRTGRTDGADLKAIERALLSLDEGHGRLAGLVRDDLRRGRDETANAARHLRDELSGNLKTLSDLLGSRTDQMARGQREQFDGFAGQLRQSAEESGLRHKGNHDALIVLMTETREQMGRQLEGSKSDQAASSKALSEQIDARLKTFGEASQGHMAQLFEIQKTQHEAFAARLADLTKVNTEAGEALRQGVETQLGTLRKENSEKLEQMRSTVDEKLQGTLEQRLGESFKSVSERLEAVHRGLGEMQTLATGVGDLKRVLTNVKTRGAWGEVQLGALLEDMLTREQYDTNVRINPDSNEVVEFAVRLPGRRDDKQPLYLPIDAKFPHEDYERLQAAQEKGEAEEVERAALMLERAVRLQARTICEKYVHPPHSTDFAIMYLPTEGLFAEVIRRPGLSNDLQSKHRIMVQGPTTLAALLTSLQMGFRTLAIEKRSSEVWQVLSKARAEFMKYGQVWDKLGKQLDTAKKTVDEAGKRTRAVERSLRHVEIMDGAEPALLTDLFAEASEEPEDDLSRAAAE